MVVSSRMSRRRGTFAGTAFRQSLDALPVKAECQYIIAVGESELRPPHFLFPLGRSVLPVQEKCDRVPGCEGFFPSRQNSLRLTTGLAQVSPAPYNQIGALPAHLLQ